MQADVIKAGSVSTLLVELLYKRSQFPFYMLLSMHDVVNLNYNR